MMNLIGNVFIGSMLFGGILIATTIATKPTDKSFDEQLKRDFSEKYKKDTTVSPLKVLSGIVSSVETKLTEKEIQDFVVFKVARVEIGGKLIGYIGVFNSWFKVQQF